MSAEDSANEPNTVCRASGNAIFTPVASPILKSVDPVVASIFLRERERYETEVQSKQLDAPSLTQTPLVAAVDRGLLKNLIFMGNFDFINENITLDNITDDHVKTFITSLVSKGDEEYDPTRIEQALSTLSFPNHVADAEARITTYCSMFFDKLESVGYGEFKSDNSKQTISLLTRHLQPPALKAEMQKRVKYEPELEKNVKRYIKLLRSEAKACQSYGQTTRTPSPGKGTKVNQNKPAKGADSSDQKREIKEPKQDPICLYPPHKEKGVRHKLKDCRACPEEEKNNLFDNFRKERKERQEKSARRVQARRKDNEHLERSSTEFQAVFAGRINVNICADNGADASILDDNTLSLIISAGADVQIDNLEKPRIFGMAAMTKDGQDAQIVCDRAVSVNTELHIRHGSSLMLRNLRWLLTPQKLAEPLLGRPLLEALGLNTRDLLAAAATRLAGTVDAASFPESLDEHGDGRVSRVLEGVFHEDGGAHDDETDEQAVEWCDLGPESEAEWEAALDSKLREATANGITNSNRDRLESLLREYRQNVRIRLNGGPAARVPPLQLQTKPNSVPVRAKPRRYPPEKRNFMRHYVKKLLQLDLIRHAERTEWVSAPLIVPKKPPAMYRLTVDYRAVNSATVKNTWPMPHIDSVLSDVRGAGAFATMDFCSGYWQLPLHEDSQHLHAFMTPDGVMQPTRTTQGGCNSAANFQACVEPCFSELRENLLAWLDDFALHGRTETDVMNTIARFLAICRQHNLVISLPKSTFFATSIRWCGRILDAKGVRMNPENYEGVRDAQEPQTASELCQYLHCMAWMASSIPLFAERAAVLHALLEKAYRLAKRRTKKAIAKYTVISLGWCEEHSEAFSGLQEQLQHAVKTAHRDPTTRLCVHTDASDSFWAAAVTQCQPGELEKPIHDQIHEPLAFLSGAFNTTQEHWSTYEREAYAVVSTFKRLDYMLACETSVSIFTDHRNLLFAFHPSALEPSLGRHKVLKVIRWALFLSTFTYSIEHVPGELNTLPDIMTRWMRGYRRNKKMARRLKLKDPPRYLVPTAWTNESDWPSRGTVLSAQQHSTPPNCAKQDKDGLWRINNTAWIPAEADELKVKLLVLAHAGAAGHRGSDATHAALSEEFTWIGMRKDVADFTDDCLLCIMARDGKRVPRPLALTLHATRPNEVLHFDYLFMGESEADTRYVLVVKDDISGYAWLAPSEKASAEHTAETLTRWNRTFTVPVYWVSDQGSHFINETLLEMASTYKISHKPTVAYSPWSNGTVERLNRDVLRAMRAMLGELKLAPHDWASVIDAIQTVLNESACPRLGRNPDGTTRTPLQVMTGIRPNRGLVRILHSQIEHSSPCTMDQSEAERIISITQLQQTLYEMHKEVNHKVNLRRRQVIERHNKATNIVQPNFSPGDYVLVRVANNSGHKLSFKWRGPRKVLAAVNPLVFLVESLGSGKKEKIHCARMRKYSGLLDGQEVPENVLDLANRCDSKYEVLEAILDIKEHEGGIWLQLQWEGLPDDRDYTWSPLDTIHEDVPDMLREFLSKTRKREVATKAASQIGISI